MPFLEHPDWVFNARFSADGQHLLTACRDHSARIWNVKTGKLACPPLEHQDEVFDANMTHDGRWVITASRDVTTRIWDARSGKPISPSIRIPHTTSTPGWGYQVTLSSDSSVAIISGVDVGRQLQQLFASSPAVTVGTTTGHLVTTRLVNVLVLDDGRIAVGAVTPEALVAAVASA